MRNPENTIGNLIDRCGIAMSEVMNVAYLLA